MRKSKVCYCEIGFLKEFFDSRPLFIEPTEERVQLLWVWASFYRFLSKAALILDISESEFKHFLEEVDDAKNVDPSICSFNEGGNFKSWLKLINKSEGPIGFTEESDTFPNITELEISEERISESDDQKLNAIYLTTLDDAQCKKYSRLRGVIILNNNLAKQCGHLFKDNGHPVPSEGANDWGFLKSLKYPSLNICNTIIIVDNYLFINDEKEDGEIRRGWEEKLEQNLHPILQALLPENLDESIAFEIAIFTTQDIEHKYKSFEDQYQNIVNYLAVKRKKIKFRVNFYGKCHEAFHDRCILTNNVWISSGRGFDIFGKTKDNTKPTSINIAFPFIQSSLLWCDGSYLNVLAQAKKIRDNRLQEPNINYWGDNNRNNRTVSYYTHKNNEERITGNKVYANLIPSINKVYYIKRDKEGNVVQ